MIVVSDTSPLQYLILIGHEHLLPDLFGTVFVPPAVVEELRHQRAPQIVRGFLAGRPAWVVIKAPGEIQPVPRLDRGELEALALAEELHAVLLIDERDGRRVAKSRGLHVIGTLGTLELGAERGLISLAPAIDALRCTDYRISERIIQSALERDRQRQGGY